jgi:predicted nucleotide-binding protein (sugar kinase/HSP70/actin superfamily)
MYDVLHSSLVNLTGINACPTVTATPETVKAAYTKENDVFASAGIAYVSPILNFTDRKLLAYQLFEAWEPILGVSRGENERAIEAGFKALEEYEKGVGPIIMTLA